jgi:hypothetical protein
MPDPESPAQETQDSPDQVNTEQVRTEEDGLPGIDEGSAEERRLDALAPVDTEQLESSQQAIDEAKKAAEPVRRHQRNDIDDEPEPAVTPDADIDESVEAVERQAEGERDRDSDS